MKNYSNLFSPSALFLWVVLLICILFTIIACDSGGDAYSPVEETVSCNLQNSPSYEGYFHTILSSSDVNPNAYTHTESINMNSSDVLAYGQGLLFATDQGYQDTSLHHLKVIDLESFTEIGRLNNVFSVLGMQVEDDSYLYVLTVGFLYQLNIDDPANVYRSDRVILSSLNAVIYNQNILSAGYSNGFFIYDLNEVEPYERRKLVGSINLGDNQIRSVSVLCDSTVVVGARDGGLYILDIENPESISVLSQYDPDNIVWDVALSGNIAYLAEGAQIEILDVSNPVAPAVLAMIEVPGFAMKVTVNEGYAAIPLGTGGTIIHDITKEPVKENLNLIPVTAGPSEAAIYHDGNLYVAETSAVLKYQLNLNAN